MVSNQGKLMEIGAAAAKAYLEKSDSLESSLIKEAEKYKLNDEEIRRVTEYANLKTYHELKKQASIVNFDVANPENILKSFKKEAASSAHIPAAYHSDYMTPPKTLSMEKKASVEKLYEKTAEDFMNSEVPAFNKELSSSTSEIEGNIMTFDKRVAILAKKAKTLLNEGMKVQQLKAIFLDVDPSGNIWEGVSKFIGLEKSAEVEEYLKPYTINRESPFIQEISSLSKEAELIVDRSIIQGAIASAFKKEAGVIIQKFKTPAKVIGAAAIAAGIYHMGKKSQESEQHLQEFEQYKNLKANGVIK